MDPNTQPIESNARPAQLQPIDYVVVGLSVAIVRAAFSWGRTSFYLSPDEIAIGGMARFLSGTDSFNMLIASTWRPGLSTLLAPIFWFTSDPELFVRIALIVNAAIAGIATIWLARLARRLTTLSRSGLVAAVIAISLTPASLSASSFVWAEPLVTLTFLAGTWNILRCYDDPRMRFGIAAIVWSLIGFTAHSRMLPFVVLVTGAVFVALVRRGERWLGLLAAGIAACGVALSSWYANWVFDAVWDVNDDENSVGTVLSRLKDPLAVLDTAAGQFWYLAATTATLFGIGIFVLVRSAVGRSGGLPRTSDAMAILFLTVPMLAVSIVFTSGRGRSDYFIYGRYNDAIIAPVLVVAVGWLVLESHAMARRSWWWLVGGMAVAMTELGLMTDQLHGNRLATRTVMPMIAGLQPMAGANGSINVVLITVVSLLIAALFFSISRWHADPQRPLLLAGCGTVLVAGVLTFGERSQLDSSAPASAVTEIEGTYLDEHQPILVAYIPQQFNPRVPFTQQRARALLYQWYLPGHEFGLLFDEPHEPGTVVFAIPEDPYLASIGADVVWRDPGGWMALWRIANSPSTD